MHEPLRAPFISFAFAIAAIVPTARAAPEDFVIDSGHAFPTFEVKHLGIATQRGRFNHTSGTVRLDRDAGIASVDILIDATSIDTGNDLLDDMLRGTGYFDVLNFPQIRYTARNVALIEGTPSVVDGELTLLGVTRPVRLAVSNYKCTRLPVLVILRCGVDMVTSFRRSEFGMSAMLGFVSDEVNVLIQAEAVRQSADAAKEGGS